MIATHLSRRSNWLLDLVKDEHKNLSSRSLRCFKNSICIVYSGAHPWEMQPIPTLSKPLLIDSHLNLTLIWPETTLKQQVLRLQNQGLGLFYQNGIWTTPSSKSLAHPSNCFVFLFMNVNTGSFAFFCGLICRKLKMKRVLFKLELVSFLSNVVWEWFYSVNMCLCIPFKFLISVF